jgi:4-cresol dehydrogenase (hydroxylating)
VVNFLLKAENLCKEHNFSPPIALHNVSERCLLVSLRLIFNKKNQARVSDAQKCYNALLSISVDYGALPSRLTIGAMGSLATKKESFWKTVKKIKEGLDPQDIISPGRYS